MLVRMRNAWAALLWRWLVGRLEESSKRERNLYYILAVSEYYLQTQKKS